MLFGDVSKESLKAKGSLRTKAKMMKINSLDPKVSLKEKTKEKEKTRAKAKASLKVKARANRSSMPRRHPVQVQALPWSAPTAESKVTLQTGVGVEYQL